MTTPTKPAQESLLDPLGTSPSLVLLQYDLASSHVPVLRQVVEDMLASQTDLIFVSLYLSPFQYLGTTSSSQLHVLDLSDSVPGYGDEESELDIPSLIASKLPSAGKGPLALVIDSPDTILADLGSHARTLDLLSHVFGQIIQHSTSCRLVLPIRSSSLLLPSLLSTTFQARVRILESSQLPLVHTLAQLVFYPPALLSHLVQHYHVTLPPINTPPEISTSRFWSVFAPVASRGTGERLVMATGADQLGGTSNTSNQFTSREPNVGVVEIITRARTGGQKGVRRVLQGWRLDNEHGRVVWCGWGDIPALKACLKPGMVSTAPAPNAMDSVSFNLQLSDAQQQARASVPLPYANDGLQAFGSAQDGEIHYIPDQADDFDDDDPDDDLYI